MKKVLLTALGVIAAIVVISGIIVWYYSSGPGFRADVARAKTGVTSGKRARDHAEAALKKVSALSEKWANLTFDDEAEATRIAADLVANRQYKVDNYRDPAAAAVAKDIAAAEKSLAATAKNITGAHTELTQTQKPFLPDDITNQISAALTENEKIAARVKKMRSGLKELKSDNYIWGHLGIVVKSDGNAMISLRQAADALSTGDYVILQESTKNARGYLADSTNWLQAGEQELINVGIYSRDAAALKGFVSQASDSAQAYEQAAIFLFGPRADAASLKQAAQRAAEEMAALQKIADAQVFGQGYKAWFLARAKSRLQKEP